MNAVITLYRRSALMHWLALCLFCALVYQSCAVDPNPERTRIPLRVGKVVLQVETATTEQEQETGLMFRTKLANDQGMLFIFGKDAQRTFWMKNTLIPLSIAYISASGEIKVILDMKPQSLEGVPSTYAVRYALEVPQGAFERAGIRVGNQMILP